jgi:hypothetical protein
MKFINTGQIFLITNYQGFQNDQVNLYAFFFLRLKFKLKLKISRNFKLQF